MNCIETQNIQGTPVEFNSDQPATYTEVLDSTRRLFERFDWAFERVEFYVYPDAEESTKTFYLVSSKHNKQSAFYIGNRSLMAMHYIQNYPIYTVNMKEFNEKKMKSRSSLEALLAHHFFHGWDISSGYLTLLDKTAGSEGLRSFSDLGYVYSGMILNGIADVSANDNCVKNGFARELFEAYYQEGEELLQKIKEKKMPRFGIFARIPHLGTVDIPFRRHGYKNEAEGLESRTIQILELADEKCPVKKSWVEIEIEFSKKISGCDIHLTEQEMRSIFSSQNRLLKENYLS